ncbi:MAG: acyl-CoA dehydrogenase family protein, partial [Thermoanaerobaculia bacterium]
MIDLATIRAFLDDQHLELAEKIDDFVLREIAPLPAPEDDSEAREQAREILALLGGDGWLMYSVPAAFGGDTSPLDLRACCLIREALAWASPLADAVFSLQCLGSLPIAIAGSDELKKRWLPDVAGGHAMAAFAMTELRAGSDVGALETRARRVDEGYVLTGRKLFISNAGLADFYTVFARTSEDGGTRGISIFLVGADTAGLRFVRPQVLSAPHPLGEIAFDDCRVASSSRIGEEGEGFKIGMRTLDRVRPTVGAGACGMG